MQHTGYVFLIHVNKRTRAGMKNEIALHDHTILLAFGQIGRGAHTWARDGGNGGDAPPLASKNLYPPLEPRIRDLQKIMARKRG